jgi:hypothetical protein
MIPPDLISGITFWVFKSLWESRDETYKLLSQRLKKSIFYASKEYQANYIACHGYIEQEEFKSSVELTKVYIPPTVVDQNIPTHPLEKKVVYHQEIDYLQNLGLAYEGIEIAQKYRHLIVRGEPGIGKTTFLKRLGLEAFSEAHHNLSNAHIPVFIQTTKSTDQDFSLLKMIEQEFEIRGFPECDGFVESALKKGKLLLLIDELDTLPIERRDHIIQKLKDFSDLYRNNRIVITGRKSKRPHALTQFQTISILGFSSTQAKRYIAKVYQIQYEDNISPEDCQQIWQQIGESGKATKLLTHNPFCLGAILSLYQPTTRSFSSTTILYEKLLSNLLNTNIYPAALDPSPKDLNTTLETRTDILAEVAYTCLKSGRLDFHRAEVSQLYASITKRKSIDLDSTSNFTDLREDYLANFIVYVNKNQCQFSNLLLQKLLVANYLMGNPKALDETIEQFLDSPAWKDVFIFLAGMQGADYLLSVIQDSVSSKIDSPQLKGFMSWIATISENVCISPNPAINRCYAVFMVFEVILLFGDRSQDRYIISKILKQMNKIMTLLDPACQILSAPNTRHKTSQTVSTSNFIDPMIIRGLSLDRLLDLAAILASKAESYRLIQANNSFQLNAMIHRLKQQLVGKDVSSYHRKVCEKNLYGLWVNSLGITDNSLDFTTRDLQSFYLYCKGSYLIIQCLKEAFYVSGNRRKDIAQTLFNYSANQH